MEYKGKLYGKIGDKYFDTEKTADDWDCLEKELEHYRQKIKIAKKALNDVLRFDDDLEEQWGDPGELANNALEKIAKLEGF